MSHDVTIRQAGAGDSRDIWEWRNDPETVRMSRSPDPVPSPDHERWYAAFLAGDDGLMLIAEDEGGEKVGMVRFDGSGDGAYEVNININPGHRGRGLGVAVLGAAVAFLFRHRPARVLRAVVRTDNPASRACFLKTGFTETGEEGGYWRFEKRAD